jgi:type II secretory pathway component PulF
MAAFKTVSTRPYLAVAVKPGGKRAVCIRSAASPSQLASTLRRERMTVLQSYPLPGFMAPGKSRMGLKDQGIFNEQLHQLLSRGVPLVEALQVAANTVSAASRSAIEGIGQQVASGVAMADACDKSGQFDVVNVAVYRAAERSGDLSGACKQLALSNKRALAVNQKAAGLLTYPLVLALVAVFVTGVMLMFVLPQLGQQFENMPGVQLPFYTKLLIGVGSWMKANALIVAGVVAFIVLTIVTARKWLAATGLRLGRRLPVVRDVLLAGESARFFAVMSAMSKSGVPLAEGLAVSNQVIGDPGLRSQLDRLRDRLVAGGVLRNLIEEVTKLPLATRKLLLAAERSGDLENAFSSLAEDMTEQVDRQSTRLLDIIQPVMIVIMAVVVGGLFLAILVPIMSASRNIGN